ncbi:ABC transporter substrate-binding protein [Massilia sp. Dwa41.01b]|uniref:substrate-binding periplasmic protein n=1 Tax=unclassified Massilia TaxID=2609279 RepID=UPI0015FF0916|nr:MULTISPECIES: ABC transporter substrate-binding protein [unclassified Massilia]QNA90535.1 ABC transporter substrate-binding protein [Massilia sp. Dwa41.01b]QNA97767.1 ABC transporter substrate-binding protein [Massilia sp. Se16.2.3]
MRRLLVALLAGTSVLAAAAVRAGIPARAVQAPSAQAGPAQASPIHIATEAAPPSSMLDAGGRVVGIATDKVRAAFERAGIAYTIDMLPRKRAYAAAYARPDACVYSTTRTPERDPLFKWVGPTDSAEWVLMAQAERRIALRTLEDARPYRIGTYHGDARDHYLRSRGFRVDAASSDMTNPRKLLIGRIDLWAAALRRGSPVLEQNGWAGRIVPVLVFNRIDVFLACNRAMPDAVIERLNGAFASLERDGTLRRIERSYDGWTARPAP